MPRKIEEIMNNTENKFNTLTNQEKVDFNYLLHACYIQYEIRNVILISINYLQNK